MGTLTRLEQPIQPQSGVAQVPSRRTMSLLRGRVRSHC
jgi:hypothetical protein